MLSRNFGELNVYLSQNPCWATMPLRKIHSSPAKLRQIITDHFLLALWHAANIAESLPRTDCCWLSLLSRLTAPPLQTHFDFHWLLRRTFAQLSQNNSYPQAPAISRGAWEEKQTLLGWCIWSLFILFLETSATLGSTNGRSKGKRQNHGIWQSNDEGFSKCPEYTVTQWTKPGPNRNSPVSPVGPPGGRGWWSFTNCICIQY